jgi:hypothetical protein
MTPTAPTPPSAPEVKPEWELDPSCLPNLHELVTEDHAPVDRSFVEKQYRLLTDALYSSWPGPGEGRPFLVLVNVAWFFRIKTPALVPDCLLSLDVTCPENLHVKEGHSYYQWEMGKSPEVVIEIVSDRRGGEGGLKMRDYARLASSSTPSSTRRTGLAKGCCAPSCCRARPITRWNRRTGPTSGWG